MLSSIRNFRKNREGAIAVEFALYLPVLVVIVFGMIELANAVVQGAIVEKSIRAGALYAARSNLPLTTARETEISNIVKTGTNDGSGSNLVAGWGKANSSVSVSISNYTMTSESSVTGSNLLPVVTVRARVPYVPLIIGSLDFLGLTNFMIDLTHEQAHIGV
ncbi:TadE/TadG family type IV pilus assembly protein [Sneathiella limimaris]|uniref:TadE/TadG family type IV pilus assembly protein n=1 Tax=Sneathiella limimaris TaxID=1964213 RepID=UPI00146ABB3A|nr:TadE/TadG family type IV pilus assembly protein [Sneathiella limimaris]